MATPHRDGVVITGSFAGVKLMLYQIVDAPEDGPHWRLYFAPRQQAIERDRAQPTTATARPQMGRHRLRSSALDLPDLARRPVWPLIRGERASDA